MNVVFESVTKSFGGVKAVDQLDLQIDPGEFVVLLGPSGCGKTTTLRMLAGLDDPTSGRIFIGGECVNGIAPRDRDIAMVFQSYALYPHMTVEENIGYPLRVRKIQKVERAARVRRVAGLLGIEHLLRRKPRELSGGERQRVALARAIIREPRVYLMDEPLSNLDAKLRLHMRGELKRLQYELKTTTVYVTHDQAEAMTLAHRIAIIDKGRLQQFDTPMNIYHRPANKFVAGFIGSPGMNFIEGRIDRDERRFVAEGMSLPLPGEALPRLDHGDRITLGIRPEDIQITQEATGLGAEGVVYVTEAMGNETLVFINLGSGKIIVRSGNQQVPGIEAKVWLSLDPSRAYFFDTDSEANLTAPLSDQ